MNPVENLGHQDAFARNTGENPDKLSSGEFGETRIGPDSGAEVPLGRGDLVVVVTSPKAGAGGSGDRIERLRDRLSELGMEVVVETDITLVQKRVTSAITARRKLCVAAAGGDGTLNLLASVLPPETPLMPFPLGTENLVARHYGLLGPAGKFDLEVAVQTVLHGRQHRIDAGVASFSRRKKSRREKMFLIMASVGFDAEVVRRMHLTRRGHINRWSYLKPILASLRKYRYPGIRVEPLDGCSTSEPLMVAWALLFNLPRYAVGLTIESLAEETDGKLDFCGLSYGSHIHGLRYLLGVLTRRHTKWKDVKRVRGASFRLSSKVPVAVQLDGDYAGRLPMDIRVEPQRVTLRLPPLVVESPVAR